MLLAGSRQPGIAPDQTRPGAAALVPLLTTGGLLLGGLHLLVWVGRLPPSVITAGWGYAAALLVTGALVGRLLRLQATAGWWSAASVVFICVVSAILFVSVVRGSAAGGFDGPRMLEITLGVPLAIGAVSWSFGLRVFLHTSFGSSILAGISLALVGTTVHVLAVLILHGAVLSRLL